MNAQPLHDGQNPSAWVQRWSHLVPQAGMVLDVACGTGRHMQCFAQRGHEVIGIDRNPAAAQAARRWGNVLEADIENGPWPLEGRSFAGVVVTNYLWRPLWRRLLASVAEGGVFIYETFAQGNETVGRPARPDFLLRRGELLDVCGGPEWRIIAYEDGFLPDPERFVQRIAAIRQQHPPPHTDIQNENNSDGGVQRYLL